MVESLANDDWFRGGNIVAFREGPGQEIFVEHFADLVVHHTGDELRADAPHARCYLERHIRRHKPKDEQKRLQVQAGAWRKGTERDKGDEFVPVAGVGDLAERAMINRATFYRHYQDKYDLVAKIFEETADSLVEHMKPFHKDADQMDLEHPPEVWVQVFEHVAEQSQLYRAMLGKNGSPWFVARMREYIVKLILENEKRWNPSAGSGQQVDPAMPEALPVMQLSHVLIGTIVWWLESEKSYTPKQIATWFCHFAFYGYLSTRGYEVPLQGKNR